MDISMNKFEKCIHSIFSHDSDNLYCSPEAKTLGEKWETKEKTDLEKCESCPHYKCRFIEYPISINEIKVEHPEPWDTQMTPVAVRPCGDETEKTYFGLYLGEMPWKTHVGFSDETGVLSISTTTNPMIYVPEIGKMVFGAECWWTRIKDKELPEITDELISSQWYMKLAERLGEADA